MNISARLFDLIKSLSKSEKRYFKLSADLQQGEKDYLFLFESLEKMPFYDKDKVKRVFKENPKALKRLSHLQRYLYEHILKSLFLYNYQNGILNVLQGKMTQIETLLSKSLSDQAMKIILESKKIATHYEQFPQLIQILNREFTIISAAVSLENMKKSEEVLKESKEALLKHQNALEYQDLMVKLFEIHFIHFQARSEMVKKELDEFKKNELLQSDQNANCYRSKNLYFNIHGLLNRMVGKYKESISYYELVVQLTENNPAQIEINPTNYIRAIMNVILALTDLGEFESVLKYTNKLKVAYNEHPVKSKAFEQQINAQIYSSYIESYLGLSEYQKALELIPTLEREAWFTNEHEFSQQKIAILFHLITCAIQIGKYPMALKWLNTLLNLGEPTVRTDILGYLQIMNLIVHFELGNTSLLPYLLKSTLRFFTNKDMSDFWEPVFVKSARELMKVRRRKDLPPVFASMKLQLEKAFNNKESIPSPQLKFVLQWLDDKLNPS